MDDNIKYPENWKEMREVQKELWLLQNTPKPEPDNRLYCTICNRVVKHVNFHVTKEHPGSTEISFIINNSEKDSIIKPVQYKGYLWFYGDDPAQTADYHGIAIQGLPIHRTSNWLPILKKLYMFQKMPHLETLRWLKNDLFRTMPPTYYSVDSTRDPTYAELIIKMIGVTRTLPLSFQNVGSINTKLDLFLIGKEYTNRGYSFPNTEILRQQKRIPVEEISLINTLHSQFLKELQKNTPSGRITFDAPSGKHNDLLHAWLLSLKAVLRYQISHLGFTMGLSGKGIHTARRKTAIDNILTEKEKITESLTKKMKQRRLGTITDINIDFPI